MKSVYLALLIAIVICIFKIIVCSGNGTNKSVIIAVTRRTYLDLYHPTDSPHVLREEQETFMVEKRRCMKNENVFKGESNTHLKSCMHNSNRC